MLPERPAAVTVDAHGTLLALEDPVPALREALACRGVEHTPGAVRAAFRAEVAYYVPRAHLGRDGASLAALRVECARVFLRELDAQLDPASFVPSFLGSLRWRPLPGVDESLDRLSSAGIALACVSNWDISLRQVLARASLAEHFAIVVSSADAGAPKPEPRIFQLALDALGIPPDRALHVGDDDVDRDGARAAGMAFGAAPLVTLPARLGLKG